MKSIKLFALIFITLISCKDIPETIDTKPVVELETERKENIELKEQEVLLPEGTEVEGDSRYDHLSNETTVSDCYIVSHFTDMDITYVTVDFVSYKLDEDSKHTDYEIYDLINVNKKLRTFVVNESYKNCGRNKTLSFEDLIKKQEQDSKTVFSIETEEGLVTELYIDICSG